MYKIGEFSKITQMPVKTLHYYDEELLLKPSMRDAHNGYRLYSEEDFLKAQHIRLLRSLDFSISEIKDIFLTCDDFNDIHYYIDEKKHRIEEQIRYEKDLLKRLSSYQKEELQTYVEIAYDIKEVEAPEVLVGVYQYEGTYADMGKHMGKIYQALKQNIAAKPIFNLYYNDTYSEETQIQICIPIVKTMSSSFVECKTIPSVKGLSLLHQGPYPTLCYAYKALLDEMKKRNLSIVLPIREIYIKGPGKLFKGNPQNYITQIIIPYKDEKEN